MLNRIHSPQNWTDRLQVGGVTNMYVITEKQMQADLVLRP